MSDIIVVEEGNKEESSYVELGCQIADALCKEYPLHPWRVSFQGGCMIVRHDHINFLVKEVLKRDGFGYLMDRDTLGHHKEVVKSAVMAGGAMLELFGYPRGKWDRERPPTIPSDWVPKQEKGFA